MKTVVDAALVVSLGLFSGFNLFVAGGTAAVAQQAESPCLGDPPTPDCTCCTYEEEPVWVCE